MIPSASFDVDEIRILGREQNTLVYVHCTRPSDGTIGIEGWYRHVLGHDDEGALRFLFRALQTQEYLRWQKIGPSG